MSASSDSQFVSDLTSSLAKLRGVHAVGDEWELTYVPKGGLAYFGQLESRSLYADLLTYATNNDLVISETEWQELYSSQQGFVPFYSEGDGSTTFRMPNWKDVVPQFAGSLAEAGTLGTPVPSGLNLITGKLIKGVYAYGVLTNVGSADAASLYTSLQAEVDSLKAASAKIKPNWASVQTISVTATDAPVSGSQSILTFTAPSCGIFMPTVVSVGEADKFSGIRYSITPMGSSSATFTRIVGTSSVQGWSSSDIPLAEGDTITLEILSGWNSVNSSSYCSFVPYID